MKHGGTKDVRYPEGAAKMQGWVWTALGSCPPGNSGMCSHPCTESLTVPTQTMSPSLQNSWWPAPPPGGRASAPRQLDFGILADTALVESTQALI